MNRYDYEKLGRLGSEFLKALEQLKNLASLSRDEFLADPHKVSSAKYNFIVAIEAAIDIGQHIISRNRWPHPEEYADVFKRLAEKGVVEEATLPDLINMVRFRNRLVHLYWAVSDEEVYRILTEKLGDLECLVETLLRHTGIRSTQE